MPKALKGIYENGRVKLLEPSPVKRKTKVIVIFQEEERPKHRVTEFEGLGKEIWEGIDAQKYVDEERKTWERNF